MICIVLYLSLGNLFKIVIIKLVLKRALRELCNLMFKCFSFFLLFPPLNALNTDSGLSSVMRGVFFHQLNCLSFFDKCPGQDIVTHK